MILLLIKYQKTVAWFLFSLFYLSIALPAYASCERSESETYYHNYGALINKKALSYNSLHSSYYKNAAPAFSYSAKEIKPSLQSYKKIDIQRSTVRLSGHPNIGGPSQPEMASFQSVGTDKMVDLFSGNFSYNIPLLDVGGYPVNIFYDGSVGMEQEASWVGLGWNINPGTINRNMRGVPDDFDGTDTLIEQQKMKKNKTWGVTVGGNIEECGLGILTVNSGLSLGLSVNNYLGPAFDLTPSVGLACSLSAASEKSAAGLQAGVGLSADFSSRTGLTLSPHVSLSAQASSNGVSASFGYGASTSYNSRSGVAALQESEQMSINLGMSVPTKDKTTTISFAKPSYIPSLRMPLTNTAYSGHIEIGGSPGDGFFADGEVAAFEQLSEVAPGDVTIRKPLVGYLYYQNAVGNSNAVMDFTRFNDKEVLPNTPIISVPQYTYDVFSIQGEGTGGAIRAYRNDVGYVRDNTTTSHDKNISIGFDIGIPLHYGGNFNTISTPTSSGEWVNGNMLHDAVPFKAANGLQQNVYFRNPGENSVMNANQYDSIGGTDLVRFNIYGTPATASNVQILPKLQHFNSLGQPTTVSSIGASMTANRVKRTQVVSFLTADEASVIGLDKKIKSYNADTLLDGNNNLKCDSFTRVSEYRKGHHISEINVTEANGKEYVYGIPVYDTIEKDFTFSVVQPLSADTDKVAVNDNDHWMSPDQSALLADKSPVDGYIEVKQIPAYAHSFLLSGVLSPNYVDLTGNGITDDDMGDAVKFDYTRIKSGGNWAVHKWRTPLTQNDSANFNAGKRSEVKDDKGIVNYGVKESWYMHSIESKSMIAVFTLKNRRDGKSANGESGGINTADNSYKCLDKIDLYNKADLKQNGVAKAKPIKTVHFWYSYKLCKGTPDNHDANWDSSGKLTLDSISFTFNGQNKLNKNKYAFSYLNTDGSGNPDYVFNGSDRWGNYKPRSINPMGMSNMDYPYSIQDTVQKTTIDNNAGAWSLKKILLPSGGQLEVNYESDDYAYVQNMRATDMTQIVGFSNTPTGTITNNLYTLSGGGNITDNNVVFIKVPRACSSDADVFTKYIQGLSQDVKNPQSISATQLSFKLWVRMPKGYEYLTCYASLSNAGLSSSDPTGHTIWVSLAPVDGVGPLTLTAIEYLREQLPAQAFPGYDMSNDPALDQIGTAFASFLSSFKTAFRNPLNYLRSGGNNAQAVTLGKSFIRLNDVDGFKYGGGQRVKSIILKDNWQPMTGQYTSKYGQTYDYTTTEVFNGATRTISSGVAAYEPSIGGEENPFQTIKQVENNLPLGPASYGSIELPVLDAFFPAPSVGYSKVTVRALDTNTDTSKASRSGVGKQVTEYYTSKDYPVIYANTDLDPSTDIEQHVASTISFFSKYAYDYKNLSQGFLVVNNDMNGKVKSQSSYTQSDDNTPISYTANYYKNTGSNGMNDKFNYINGQQTVGIDNGGIVTQGNTGIDVELMNDVREFSTSSKSQEWQINVDVFYVPWPLPIPFPWPVFGTSENTYRAVTTTKVVNYHSVLDSVVVIDKGSQVATKNLLYDAETGNVIVSRTNNEFNQPVYSTSYPAYWAYSGMGPAYKNIDAVYNGVNFANGVITNLGTTQFESGDELYLSNPGSLTGSCPAPSHTVSKLWAFDKNKNTSSLTDLSPNFIFIDSAGQPYSNNGVNFRIVRSGKRNMLGENLQTVTSLNNPVINNAGIQQLIIRDSSKIINASAAEYKEKWQIDGDEVQTYNLVTNTSGCTTTKTLQPTCGGSILETTINPYCKGLLGNYKAYKSFVFYGDRTESNPLVLTNLPKNGFIKNFKLYWDFIHDYNNLVPDTSSKSWVWNDKVTKINSRGLELETKNALNIYTGAQYGYNKNLPVAITNNARSNEAAYTGFEDANYNQTIDPNTTAAFNACKQQHFFDLTTMSNSNIVNTDSTNFTAHTGKYVLGVNANTTATTAVSVMPAVVDDYVLSYGSYTPIDTTLTNPGVNISSATTTDTVWNQYPMHVPFSNFVAAYTVNGNNIDGTNLGAGALISQLPYTVWCTGPGNGDQSNYNINLTQYIDITDSGTYEVLVHAGYYVLDATPNSFEQFWRDNVQISITNLQTNTGVVGFSSPTSQNFTFCRGKYLVNFSTQAYILFSTSGGTYGGYGGNFTNGYFIKNISGGNQPVGYKTLVNSTSSGCTSVVPIAAKDSMLNAAFSIPASKKMIFSAWVKEKCGNLATGIPCTATSYTNNQVNLIFSNNINNRTLKPSGPIIEGWQRYEDTVLAPPGATSMSIQLVNSSSSPIYFDDIRLEPFNANMKNYVYDPISQRLVSQLDENNYATFYEYDAEGTLVRTKAETVQGIKTITETRSAKQKNITTVQ